jgi:hypothetical protein
MAKSDFNRAIDARSWLRRHASFALAFVALAAMTVRMHAMSPLGPGQDHHFHLLVAAIHGMASDHPVKALYAPMSPLDANTLLYSVAWPFEKIASPVTAFQIATLLLVYLGFPIGVAYALTRAGRSPWGALLAFPIVYTCNTWFNGGFYPFLSAAGFFVAAIAEHDVLMRCDGHDARVAKRVGVTCAALCALTFVAHAHVYAWLVCLLALRALLAMNVRAALRSLAVVAPSGALLALWYARSGRDAPVRTEPPLVDSQGLLSDKLHNLITLTLPTRDEDAFLHVAVFLLLVLGVLLLVRRGPARDGRTRSGLTFELCILVTAASYFVLPAVRHGGTVAQRQLDIALWLLPLVLFPSRVPLRSVGAIAVAAVAVFSVWRMSHFSDYLRRLNDDDYRGLLEVSDACKRIAPRDRAATLAFATSNEQSKYWQSLGPQQSHETLAAVCGLETPVYDTAFYPHSLQPLRYRGRISAPVTILNDATRWYERPGIFDDFDFVLVKGWNAAPDEEPNVRARADLVASAGDYQLWRRH